MKKLFRMKGGGGVIILAALVLLMGACDLGLDNDPNTNASGVDYTNYATGSYSIKVNNASKTNVVAFHSELAANRMIGGVRAETSNWALKDDVGLFSSTPQTFKVIFITEAQYTANKDNLSALANNVFAQIYVYWNGRGGDNSKVYDISQFAGGEYEIRVQNPSQKFDVELRVGGINGPVLGFSPAGMVQTILKVGFGDYTVYPVFRYYNRQREVVETIYPTYQGSTIAWYQSFNFEPGTQPQNLNLSTALSNVNQRSSGVAYIIIENGFQAGAVSFVKGNSTQFTAMGTSMINSGMRREFMIEMPTVTGSSNYATQITVNNYKVSLGNYTEIPIKDQNGSESFVLKVDKSYTVYVSGIPGGTGTNAPQAVVNTDEDAQDGPVDLDFSNDYLN